MRTLILYFSLTGHTTKICRNLQKNSGLDMEKMRERGGSLFSIFPVGFIRAIKGKGTSLMPIERDVAGCGRIILAGPVWCGHPAPALVGFLSQYELTGKEVCCILTHSGKPGQAEEVLRECVRRAGGICVCCENIQCTPELLGEVTEGKVKLTVPISGVIEQQRAEE